MNTNLEIEFKCLITKEQYESIKQDYFVAVDPIVQTNEYFVDSHHLLADNRYSLRVRHLANTYEFTLKKPQGFAKLELNEMLSEKTYQDLIDHRSFPSFILTELEAIGVQLTDLSIYTALTTTRYQKPYLDGELFLDFSQYSGVVDYEIEYEASEQTQGKEDFINLLSHYGINYLGNCPGKLTRAFNAKTILPPHYK